MLKTKLDALASEFAQKIAEAIKSAPLEEIVAMTQKPRVGRPYGSKNKVARPPRIPA